MGRLLRRLAIWTASFLALGHVSAQNILNNSGFEYGLMCYLTNVWSYTGVFGAGDYKILLSPDAHSGSQSLEISCSGADCQKGAVISGHIPSAPNENYTLRLYAKCLPGATAAVYIPFTAGGDTFALMNCTGAWELNTINFRTSTTAQDFYYYLFSYYGGWVRFDDVVFTYADGTIPSSFSLYPGTRNVSLSNRTLFVDGTPYLALGFFDVPYNDLAQAAATGANTLFGLGTDAVSAACFNTKQKGYVDRVYELGMSFVPESSTTARLGVPSATASAVQRFAPHRANIAWMLADEPDQTYVPLLVYVPQPSKYLEAYSAAKSQTSLPVFADFQRAAWSVTSDVSPYQSGSDILMAEPYGTYLENITHATNMFKSFSPPRPMWMAQDDTNANLIVPKAYWSVIQGSTGIAFFRWASFKANGSKMAAAQQALTELNSLKSAIFSQNADSLVSSSSGVGTIARSSNGSTYILAVNPAPQTVQATFAMGGLTTGQKIQVLFENRTITASTGRFTDSFAGVVRHVYVIQAPTAAISGSILAKSGPDNARKWTIQISNTGGVSVTGAAITSTSFVQTPGPGSVCTPRILSTLPVTVGPIAPALSATGDLMLSFTGCKTSAKFTVNIGLAANDGNVTSSIVRTNERK